MGVMRNGWLLGVAIGLATWALSSARRRDDGRRGLEDDHDRWEGEGGNVPSARVETGLHGRPDAAGPNGTPA